MAGRRSGRPQRPLQQPLHNRHNKQNLPPSYFDGGEDIERGRPRTPYHIVEILLNGSGGDILPGINVSLTMHSDLSRFLLHYSMETFLHF